MVIDSIDLKNYRNYEELHIDLNSGTNILYGDNAQGKTNILESAYVCCTSKSHRNARDREMIRFGQDEAHIKLMVNRRGVPHRIDMHLKKNRPKGIAVNGVPIRRASELFGMANLVCFSPEDLNIIKNGPSERRRFLDLELCQLNKLYVHSLVQYNKVLLQRNRLLKDISFKPEYESMLEVWDGQLVRYGIEVIRARREFTGQLGAIIEEIHSGLSGGSEKIRVSYEPDTDEAELEAVTAKNHSQDIRQKTTVAGPHRDDLSFMVNEIDIRRFGSQGQQRTAALSLKLSELALVKQLSKDDPVLLLDDVLSELDSSRQDHLLSAIQGIQTLITCTGLEDLIDRRFQMDRIFRVYQGTVERENNL